MGRLVQLDTVFTDPTLPKFYPNDGILNTGSLMLFDFGRAMTYAGNTLPTAGSVFANNTSFTNLVTGAPIASLAGGNSTYTNGAVYLKNSNYISLGDNYNVAAMGSPNFVVMVWMMQLSDFNTANYVAIMGRANNTSANNSLFYINTGIGGTQYQTNLQNSAGVDSRYVQAGPVSINTVVQLAISFESGVVRHFVNGVAVQTSTLSGPLSNPTVGAGMRIGHSGGFGYFTGKIYRSYIENLTVSGKTAAAQVAADYATNASRFS